MLVERHRADWQGLKYFWAVAEERGFAPAARKLGVSTSTLTRAVEELEARLGAQLLHRSTTGITLTDAGEDALDLARTMARTASAIERLAAGELRDEGVVRLVAPDGVAAYALAPALADFQQAYPKIALNLECGFWPTDPLGGHADISVQYDEVTDPDAVPVVLGHMHFCLFARPPMWSSTARRRPWPRRPATATCTTPRRTGRKRSGRRSSRRSRAWPTWPCRAIPAP